MTVEIIDTIPAENWVEKSADNPAEISIDSLPDRKIGSRIEKPHLDGKTVFLDHVELLGTGEIRKSKDGTKSMETLLFKVFYGVKGSEEKFYENYGGVSRFVRSSGEKSEPTINIEGKNAASNLFKVWLSFKRKKPEEVSFKEFFKSLHEEKLVVRLKEVMVSYQGESSYKNVVEVILGRVSP